MCKWMSDDDQEICCNGDCLTCADFCPTVNYPGLCKWEEVDDARDDLRAMNCPNCGAPLHSDVCEYCGSHVYAFDREHNPVKIEFEGKSKIPQRYFDPETKQWKWGIVEQVRGVLGNMTVSTLRMDCEERPAKANAAPEITPILPKKKKYKKPKWVND